MGNAAAGSTKSVGRKSVLLIALIMLQTFCVAFFVTDLLYDDLPQLGSSRGSDVHIVLEVLANIALLSAVVVEIRYLRQVLARQAHTERALSIASGALHDVMEDYFRQWGLTPSEADIAAFTIKGYSIAEIARLRGTAEGTVKTHLNAIYRKSGLAGRGQLVSILIEDLVRPDLAPLAEPPYPPARPGAARVAQEQA
jgi:DNA-binding CsgD family transcriptional regulator